MALPEVSYFSAKPKLMETDLFMPSQEFNLPQALSFQRNGQVPSTLFTEKQVDVDTIGDYFGASIRQGPHMKVQEDRFTCNESSDMSYYAVFDGHAGSEASTYCQKNLHAKLSATIQSSDPG